MLKFASLYICTGEYNKFFKGFYESSKKFLLNDDEDHVQKHYFIFTDQVDYIASLKFDDVTAVAISHKPWPLITLLRYHLFLDNSSLFKDYDYAFFFNANIEFVDNVTAQDFLPVNPFDYAFAIHPGFRDKPSKDLPVERREFCQAYIPFNTNIPHYVTGAMWGGKTAAFLKLCELLKERTEQDLRNNVIAIWHDESHLNWFATNYKEQVKFLSSSYCYPSDREIPLRPIIKSVPKDNVFDLKSFKGNTSFKDKVCSDNSLKYLKYKKRCKSLQLALTGVSLLFIALLIYTF